MRYLAQLLIALAIITASNLSYSQCGEPVPKIIISSQPLSTATIGQLYEYTIEATAPSGGSLDYSLLGAAYGMYLNQNKLVWPGAYVVAGRYPITLRISNGTTNAEQSFVITVGPKNTKPKISSLPPLVATVGRLYQYDFQASDADGDTLIYSLVGAPAGMIIDGSSVRWTPVSGQTGPKSLAISVSDGKDTVQQPFKLNVGGAGQPIITSLPAKGGANESLYQYTVIAVDPENNTLTYQLTQRPNTKVTMVGNTVNWNVGKNQTGDYPITVQVSDGVNTALQSYTLHIGDAVQLLPAAIVITSTPPLRVFSDDLYQYVIEAYDAEGGPLSYLNANYVGFYIPPLERISLNGNIFTWDVAGTYTSDAVRDLTLYMDIADQHGRKLQHSWTVKWSHKLVKPKIVSNPVRTALVGQPYQYVITGQSTHPTATFTTSYRLVSGPVGMTLTNNVVNWMPAANQIGWHSVIVEFSNQFGDKVEQQYAIQVTQSINNAPTITAATKLTSGSADSLYRYTLFGKDADGDTLTYALSDAPAGMTISGNVITWQPTQADLGSRWVTVVVSDGKSVYTQDYQLQIQPHNNPPTLTSAPVTAATAGAPYAFQTSFTDSDGPNTPRIYLQSGPAGMSNTTTKIQWTPTAGQVGSHPVTFAVSDGINFVEHSYTITVANSTGNRLPIISSTAPTAAAANVKYEYTVLATDADNDSLAYSLAIKPTGMTIAANKVTWTPSSAQVGAHAVKIVVSDGKSPVEQPYTITVTNNSKPVITSTAPTSAMTNTQYKYTVIATDADGDAMTYTLPVKPAGMTIVNNAISWTPELSQVGTHNVRVAVSDGKMTTEQNYAIVVTELVYDLAVCPVVNIADDGDVVDEYPAADIPWIGSNYTDVHEIEEAFNHARVVNGSVNQFLIMPAQSVWDAMTVNEQTLYLINSERRARGIKPYEGISPEVQGVAQAYSNYIRANNQVIGHYNDGLSPSQRLDANPLIAVNHDFNSKPESIFSHYGVPPLQSSSAYTVQAVYYWTYYDGDSQWGHRDQILLTELDDNSGASGQEGLIGLGVSRGAYDPNLLGPGTEGIVIVLNTIDPSASWDHDTTVTVDTDGAQGCNNHTDVVIDTTTISNPELLVEIILSPSDILLVENESIQMQVIGVYEDSSQVDLSSSAHFVPDARSLVDIDSGVITAGGRKGNTYVTAIVGALRSNSIWVRVGEATDLSNLSDTFAEDYLQFIPSNATVDSYNPKAFSIFTGAVFNRDGMPLEGVTVSYLNRPQYGSVVTDSSGRFGIAGASGGQTLVFKKAGYLTLHRSKSAASSSWAVLDDVVLLEVDAKQTSITLGNSAPQTHVSTPVFDAWGARSTTLVFDDIDSATITAPDGSTREVSNFAVRATEFERPASMPAPLPHETAFTFCADLQIQGVRDDEEVSFDKPVVMYVDNFLNFDVGEIIPIGYYDRIDGAWKASENGVVVQLLDANSDARIDGVDYDGDGSADDINKNGSTSDEAAGIENYPVGATYWRGSFTHFTPFDFNLASDSDSDPNDPADPDGSDNAEDENDTERACVSSYVKPYQLVLHEDIPITGTALKLHYTSQRTQGYEHRISFKITNDTVSSGLQTVTARLEIGGRVFEEDFEVLDPGMEAEFYWDGKDAGGNRVPGETVGLISIGYQYGAQYSSFGNVATDTQGRDLDDFSTAWAQPGVSSTGVTAREDETYWIYDRVIVKNTFASQLAEGWSIANVHEQTKDNRIFTGDGEVIESTSLSSVLKTGITGVQYQTPGQGGDDGYYQKGGSTIDYVITDSGVLQDRVTGLAWQFIDNPEKFRSKQDAQNYCAGLFSDTNDSWRLPTYKETTYTIDKSSALHESRVYRFDALGLWKNTSANPNNNLIPVICVRGESLDTKYVTGLKRDASNEVVVDGQNGLMWQDDSSAKDEGALFTWTEAIDHCELLDHAGYSDWRLPNINELAYALPNSTFMHETALALPQGTLWSASIDASLRYRKPYWTSTPNFVTDLQAWAIESASFAYPGFAKTDHYNVRCVRDDLTQLRSPYRFDQNGRHTETLDVDSGISLQTIEYNGDGSLQSIVDQFGNALTINRDVAGEITLESIDGYETKLTIDANNDLKRVDYDDGTYFEFDYTNSLMDWEQDRKANEFWHYFDDKGRVEYTLNPEDGRWDFSSSKLLNGTTDYGYSTIEGNNYQTIRSVLANGDVQKVTTDIHGTVTTNVTQADNLRETVASCGILTTEDRVLDSKTLDEIPQTITRRMPSGLTHTTSITKTYGEQGADTTNYTLNTVRNGKASATFYDSVVGLRRFTSAKGRIYTSNFDPNTSLLMSDQLPSLLATSYTYDSRGRLKTVTQGTRVRTYHYNDQVSKGAVTSIEADDGKQTGFTYDPVGRLDVTTYPDSKIIDQGYDDNGNVNDVQIPTLKHYVFTFDGVDELETETTPLGKLTQYIRDRDGYLEDVIMPSTATIHHDYVDGLIDQTATPEGLIDYTYDCGGKIDTITQASETLNYDYNGDLLTSITYQGELNQAIVQGYNNDFRVNSLTYAGGSTSVSYDDDGVLSGIHGFTITPKPQTALPETVTNGPYTQTLGYNSYGEVNSVNTVVGTSAYRYTLTYNDLGQITNKQETLHSGTVNNYVYTYDPNRRWLKTVTKNGIQVENYAYDANGNRILHTNTARSITNVVPVYNDDDQLTNDGNGTTYTYTPDGYLKTATSGGAVTTYQYGSQGQLLSVQRPVPALSITYRHNAMGNRVAKLIGGTVDEKYLWRDKTTLLATYDANGNLKQRFEYTIGNTPSKFTQGGQTYYIATDHLGSPRAITNASGTVLKAMTYDAWGNMLVSGGSQPNLVEIPFGFAGGLNDKDTGLIRFGYRDYDPKVGKWTARDPIGLEAGPNVYSYVSNDPINYIDLSGLELSRIDRAGVNAASNRTFTSATGREVGGRIQESWINQKISYTTHKGTERFAIPGLAKEKWFHDTVGTFHVHPDGSEQNYFSGTDITNLGPWGLPTYLGGDERILKWDPVAKKFWIYNPATDSFEPATREQCVR